MDKNENIAALIRSGSQDGYRQLFAEYGQTVYRSALEVTGERGRARDVSQAVFTRIIAQIKRGSDLPAPVTIDEWVAGEARRLSEENEDLSAIMNQLLDGSEEGAAPVQSAAPAVDPMDGATRVIPTVGASDIPETAPGAVPQAKYMDPLDDGKIVESDEAAQEAQEAPVYVPFKLDLYEEEDDYDDYEDEEEEEEEEQGSFITEFVAPLPDETPVPTEGIDLTRIEPAFLDEDEDEEEEAAEEEDDDFEFEDEDEDEEEGSAVSGRGKKKALYVFLMVLMVVLIAILGWMVVGILMSMGVIPEFDLGYEWFNTHLFGLF